MSDRVRYERKTVKAVRGTDRMVAAKWEKRGWDLVDQTPGTVQTVMTFRRRRTLVTRNSVAIVALAVAVVAAVTVGALTESDDKRDAEPSLSSTDEKATIDGLLAALQRGDLDEYVQEYYADPIEFDAVVEGVGPPALKRVGIINLRAVVDGGEVGPVLKLVFGGFSIPFPTDLERGQRVRVRADIDRYFTDDEVWLAPDDGSFIRRADS